MAVKEAWDFMKEYNLFDDFIKFNKAIDKKIKKGIPRMRQLK